MSDATVVKVDPYDNQTSFLVPFIAQRIIDTAKTLAPEASPLGTAKMILPRFYQGDPTQLVLALVNLKSEVVGHAVAQLAMDSEKCWCVVSQIRADANVGKGQKAAMEAIRVWAQKGGATKLVLITGKGDKSWEDEFGFKLSRQIKTCDVTLQPETSSQS